VVGDCHRLRLKEKLDGASPFDVMVDPYADLPGKRYLCLKADLAEPSEDPEEEEEEEEDQDSGEEEDEPVPILTEEIGILEGEGGHDRER